VPAASAAPPGDTTSAVEFTPEGKLKRPVGYRNWVYVGEVVTPNDMNDGEASFLEFRQFDLQQVVIPIRQLVRFVVGDAIGADLLSGQIRRDARNRRPGSQELRSDYKVGKPLRSPTLHSNSASARAWDQMTGFPKRTGHHGVESGPAVDRRQSTQWLSDERIAGARRVWSKAYGRVISDAEAGEILNNMRRLAEVLLKSTKD
jgi:hypothetical protein